MKTTAAAAAHQYQHYVFNKCVFFPVSSRHTHALYLFFYNCHERNCAMDQMSVQYIECLERWYAYAYGIVEAAAATPPPTTTMTAPTRWAVIAEYTSNTYVQDIQYDAKIYNRLT